MIFSEGFTWRAENDQLSSSEKSSFIKKSDYRVIFQVFLMRAAHLINITNQSMIAHSTYQSHQHYTFGILTPFPWGINSFLLGVKTVNTDNLG